MPQTENKVENKVWIVELCFENENPIFWGVFSTKEKAMTSLRGVPENVFMILEEMVDEKCRN